jgi:hypothetical protein
MVLSRGYYMKEFHFSYPIDISMSKLPTYLNHFEPNLDFMLALNCSTIYWFLFSFLIEGVRSDEERR